MKKEYTDREISEAVDHILSCAFIYDTSGRKNNYKSGSPYDEPGEMVKELGKPALKYATEKQWNRRIK